MDDILNILDPWESAEQAKEPQYSNEIWGQVFAKSWYCVLEKGVGKVEFNPQIHDQDQRRTAIDIIIRPLPEMDLIFDVTRRMIAESREWASFILPSVREMGISPRELNEKWVKVQIVPLTDPKGNQITYTDNNGVVKDKTTIKFVKIFKDEDECRADYLNNSGKTTSNNTSSPGSNGNSNKDRQTALAFLRVYVQNVCRGESDLAAIRDKLAAQIATQPLISKYFTIDSPETVELISQCLE